MKTSFFTVMGLFALVGLGAAGPVAKQNNKMSKTPSQGSNPFDSSKSGDSSDSSKMSDSKSKSKNEELYICKSGPLADVGKITCLQCGGTPVPDSSCAPSLQGCKGPKPDCFTDEKCQKEYGKESKADQCGKKSENGLKGSHSSDSSQSGQQSQESGQQSDGGSNTSE